MQGIYLILNEFNGKCYIGQSVDIKSRFNEHRSTSFLPHRLEYNYPLYRAIRKYGLDWFSFHILEEVEIKDDLTSREQFWYKIIKPEYNQIEPRQTPGNLVSKPVLQIDKNTLEIIDSFDSTSDAARFVNTAASNISSVCTRRNCSAAGFYWCFSDKYDENWKPKRHIKAKQVIQLDLETGEIIKEFESAAKAAKETKIFRQSIIPVCKGKYKQAGGFGWKYKE